MDIFTQLMQGFAVSLTGPNLLACTIGVVVGTLTGVLPGIGVTGTMALLLPISFGMVSAHFWNFSRSEASPVMYFSSTPLERIWRHL